jgi:hypothetical protein
LLLISLAFVNREEKLEQEKGKGAKHKKNIPNRFYFSSLTFYGFSFPPQHLSFCVEVLKQVHQG